MISTSPGLKPSRPQRAMPSSTATPRSARKIGRPPRFCEIIRPCGVDQAAAIVAHLVDHHVVGGLAQRIRHLVGIGDDGVAHDLDGDGMGVRGDRHGSVLSDARSMIEVTGLGHRHAVAGMNQDGRVRLFDHGGTDDRVMPAGIAGRHRTRASQRRLRVVEDHVARASRRPLRSASTARASHSSAIVSARGAVRTRRRLTISSCSSTAAWP